VLTLFAAPKAFVGDIALIQRNALESWKRLGGSVEVVLCGDEEGIAEAARAAGARHVARVTRNAYGTPLLDSVFREASAAARRSLLAYVNADIILLPDFLESVRRVRLERFLIVGRRWNVNPEPIDFQAPDWVDRLRARVASDGELDPPTAVDYFVFHRHGPLAELPPFAVGRPPWDNWMIFNARRRRIPVVDATAAITAIHQRHTHDHVKAKREGAWFGPESDANYGLIEEVPHFRTFHATHVLTARGLRPALRPAYLRQRYRTRDFVDGRVERLARTVAPAVAAARKVRRTAARTAP
jgi:hypothetical protein